MLKSLFRKRYDRVSFKVCEKEYQSPELNRLYAWLNENGWSLDETGYHVVGSQEIKTYDIIKGEDRASLVFETYEGVMLFTSPELSAQFNDIKLSDNQSSESIRNTEQPNLAVRIYRIFYEIWQAVDNLSLRRFRSVVPKSDVMVSYDDDRAWAAYSDGTMLSVTWSELQRVEIQTQDTDLPGESICWVLIGHTSECRFPRGAIGEGEMIERLQRLEAFDIEQVSEALWSPKNTSFVCWERTD